MSVLKYVDPDTGEVKRVFAPNRNVYTKTETDELLKNKASVSKSVTVTLYSSSWDSSIMSQTVRVAGVTATSNGSLRIAQSATDDQFTAWGAAKPRVTAQSDGSITVKLTGTVPTIDIPVEVLIV